MLAGYILLCLKKNSTGSNMFVFVVLAFWLMSARISLRFKKNICDAMGVSGAVIILVLYIQAYLGGLSSIFHVAAIYCAYAVASSVIAARRGDVSDIAQLAKAMAAPEIFLYVLTAAFVTYMTKDAVFTWWDDINFWSSDAKQLFYLGGFPAKYGNVSPEFGDYPPVTSLVKWLFLQISQGEYRESLQFGGYFAANLLFMMPLFGRISDSIRDKKTLVRLFAVILSFVSTALFPGIFNGIIYYGTPADITMAIIYGALLVAIADRESDDAYYFGRIGLYTAVLLLTKSVGIEWAVFALVFWALFGKKSRWILASCAGAAAAYGGWLGFCLVNRRVAKLTGAGLKMATGSYSVPENASAKLSYFISGLFTMPMHADRNVTVDLSSGAAFIIILLLIALLYANRRIDAKTSLKLFAFTLITGIAAYGIVFLAHISIFGTEDQYLDAYAMAISVTRYVAPFTLGMNYYLASLFFIKRDDAENKDGSEDKAADKKAGKSWLPVLIFAAAVLLTADYSGVYRHLVGYRSDIAENISYNDEMVGDSGRRIAKDVKDAGLEGKRVLVLRDGHEYYWVHNAYISKEASPVALVYDVYMIGSESIADVEDRILKSHASYIYVDDENPLLKEFFSPIINEGIFEDHKVYSIYRYNEGGAQRCYIGE